MRTFLASIDSGNGFTNAIGQKPTAKRTQSAHFPSVRATATGDNLGLGVDFELQYELVSWNGHTFIVGDDVIRITKRGLDRHMGVARYGDEMHRFLTAVALTKMGVKSGEVDLTLFAPPGLYTKVNPIIQERFLSGDGSVCIKLRDDKKLREWRYTNVTVWPEGIGAALCFTLDDNGQPVQNDILSGEVVVLDIGAFTLDALQMSDGNFNPESLQHATWENAGLNNSIREPILREVRSIGSDFEVCTVDDIDLTMRKGLETGDYILNSGGYDIDIKPLLDKQIERYAGWIANNIVDGVFNSLRGIKNVILVGGGATLVQAHLREWYGNKFLDPANHPTTKDVHPVAFNAVGGLRLALNRYQQS